MSENAEKEPTMEEILSSIRRIISEEDEEPGAKADAGEEPELDDEADDVLDLTEPPSAPARPAAPVAAMPEEEEDDILVLDQDDMVEPESAPPAPAPAPALEMARVAPEPAPEPAAEMAGVGEREEPAVTSGSGSMDWGREEGAMTDRLTGESAAAAAAGAFARLQRATRVPESSDDKSLETIVRELLRPMLKDWLDANLPGIVEKQVREEVERIARQS